MLISVRKRGQIAIFIIMSLVIVSGIIVYYSLKERELVSEIPIELLPVFDYFLSCIEEETNIAIDLAGTQGGWIGARVYVLGSEYAPFSSNLNFLGFPVPYWYYVSGNGLIKEQVPSEGDIEREIELFVQDGLKDCDFEQFYRKGFSVDIEERDVKVDIQDDKVKVDVSSEMGVSKGKIFWRKIEHEIEIDSKLGKFYRIGKEIYEKQKEEAFFEQYGIDVLRLYAPVDGVEIQCGAKVWSTKDVIKSIKEGLESNIGTLKFDGNYYELKDERNYFIIDKKVDENVNLVYSKIWPTRIEIIGEGVDDEVMISESIGTQEGLGAMGFCYVSYHFVYDLSFPILIQIYDNKELFQFPVVVIIDNNVPREVEFLNGDSEEEEFDLCEFKTQDIEINVFDVNLNSVDVNISYECFDQRCRIGETKKGKLKGIAPACYDGYLHLRAEGYEDKKQLFSTNEERIAEVILEREHELEIEIRVDENAIFDNAVISFASDEKTVSAVLPEVNKIKLAEGSYEIRVYVYGNSSIIIPSNTRTQCQEIPREGLLGLFGSTKEECFDITIPETKIDYALIGGGKNVDYLLESDLEKGKMIINVKSLPKPKTIEELQNNFEIFETRGVNIEFE